MIRTNENRTICWPSCSWTIGEQHQNFGYFNVFGVPMIDIQAPLYFMKLCRLAKNQLLLRLC